MKSSRPARRRRLLWLLVIIIAIVCWFWPKKVSSESYSYYSSLLCLIAGNPQNTPTDNFSTVLQKPLRSLILITHSGKENTTVPLLMP